MSSMFDVDPLIIKFSTRYIATWKQLDACHISSTYEILMIKKCLKNLLALIYIYIYYFSFLR